MKVHSVVGISDQHIMTRETTCVCHDCYTENGFNENTNCQWEKHSLTKPPTENKSQTTTKNESIEQNTHVKIDGRSELLNTHGHTDNTPTAIELCENDFVVVLYDNKTYIGKIVDIDGRDNEVEVTCMEKCGKIEGRFKWPRNEDKIWRNQNEILKIISEPEATGKSRRVFDVPEEIVLFMNNYAE